VYVYNKTRETFVATEAVIADGYLSRLVGLLGKTKRWARRCIRKSFANSSKAPNAKGVRRTMLSLLWLLILLVILVVGQATKL